VVGTQADRAKNNKITVMKFSNMDKTLLEDEDNNEDEDGMEEEEGEAVDVEPVLDHISINHFGGVNRIRV